MTRSLSSGVGGSGCAESGLTLETVKPKEVARSRELEEEEATEKERASSPKISPKIQGSVRAELDAPTEDKPRNLSPMICPKILDEDPNLAYLKLLAEAKPLTSELEQKDREFREALQQWGSHQDIFWRGKMFSEAKKYQEQLQSAKKVAALEWRESAI